MLSENENVISFCPGSVKDGQVTLGRIIVHDRIKVENEILPRYFNHSSFASLRRQLNYFSFTRIGKGRQKGATYCNEGVIVIEDILRLRRRSTSVSSLSTSDGSSVSTSNRRRESIGSSSRKVVSLLPSNSSIDIASPKNKTKRALYESSFQQTCNGGQSMIKKVKYGDFTNIKGTENALHIDAPSAIPTLVSPVTSPLHSPSTSPSDTMQVTLDLTIPTSQFSTPNLGNAIPSRAMKGINDNIHQAQRNQSYSEDPDIIAGCRALLCFSHGLHSLTA